MIQLDTSFLIRALDSGSPEDRKLRDWIGAGETLSMSAVAWAEFLCGPLDGSELALATQIVESHSDFTSDHAAIAARLFNGTGRRRGSLIDCMIAAVALADGAAIATENVADFRRFEAFGLKVV
ncbi:MAG: PIN domain-containing protein [Truepera sp.]|nr:PIN domain-containing protein [Truepera sp.]